MRPKILKFLILFIMAMYIIAPISVIAQDAVEATAAAVTDVVEVTNSASESEAPELTPADTATFVFNSLLFLIGGFLVMWMAAGFAMLEAGLVQTKNVSMQCLKNIMLYSVAGILFWVCGYNLMYGVGGADALCKDFIGQIAPYSWPEPGKSTGNINEGVVTYSVASDWFFQMVFCATTASIVSGTVAERIKFWPFIIFTILLTGFIYPIVGAWEWGGGWLNTKLDVQFSDFAGSTLVHSTGGWAALSGALILGARSGKYGKDGRIKPMVASNIPLATLGTFILWMGWFGFNGASQLAMGSITHVADIARIFCNTNLAACGGVVACALLCQILYGKIDVTMALNGALAGLVAITAEPLYPSPLESILIGAVGGVIVVVTVPILDKLKIDDVVGAIPVHLVSGIFGTMIVPFTNDGTSYVSQAIGVGAVAGFVFVISSVLWLLLKFTIGIRVSEEHEREGLDKAEVGVAAYPEFVN